MGTHNGFANVRKNHRTKRLICIVISLMAFTTMGGCAASDKDKPQTTSKGTESKSPDIASSESPETDTANIPGKGVFLVKGTPLKSLDVIPVANLKSNSEKVLVATLQGLVAKTSSEQIYIDEGRAGSNWKNYMNTQYGIALDNSYKTWDALLGHFKDKVSGYILYDISSNPKSLNVATSLCGPNNAIAVDVSLEENVKSLGITQMIMDVSTKDEKWAYDNHKALFNAKQAAELNTTIFYHLRDYATMSNLFTFYERISPWRRSVLKGLDSEAFLLGYGSDEFAMINQASHEGVTSVPSDMAPNLSALSSIYSTEGLKQKTIPAPKTEDKHYVCFVISDGDNVAWDLWGLYDYFKSPKRGTFSVGYGISPAMVDLAPAPMRWYYENANDGEYKDEFIAGPSGSGYTFPSRMSPGDLDTYVNRLDDYMGKSDLRISEILDQGALNRGDVWEKFLSKPNIDALFYFGYGESTKGEISFYNGKPLIAQRDVLWKDLTEEETLIKNINARPADPKTADGYTLVLVHCWTKSMSSIKTVVDGLNPNVKVVTPGEFVSLIQTNMGGNNNSTAK